MAYLALARKWRPQTFESISGQEHVTRTLMNAIAQDRVHHAFLFCGARGVGKTTAARVLARALNCTEGPTQTPCGQCKACNEIATSSSIDVLEIDGASNRGISEIRELRESVAYAPQRDRTKIYIIDEVHMLTTEAFNALLKTLEEPPSHVKFIFATTEPQKIPVTILSRCQRFDFKRIPQEEMLTSLRSILKEEGVEIDDPGLRMVARESEGSMRDALSLLDRIISFCGEKADAEQISRVLGVADRRWIDQILAAALSGDSPAALNVIADVFEYGTDLRHFTKDLVRSLRDLVILRVAPNSPNLTDLSDTEREQHLKRISDHAPQRLQQLFQLALDASERLAHTSFPRLELEMAIVRMCHVRPLKGIDGLVQRLGALERRLGGAPPAPSPPASSEGGHSRPFESTAPAPKPAPSVEAKPQAPSIPSASVKPEPVVTVEPVEPAQPEVPVEEPTSSVADASTSDSESSTEDQAVVAMPESVPAPESVPVLELVEETSVEETEAQGAQASDAPDEKIEEEETQPSVLAEALPEADDDTSSVLNTTEHVEDESMNVSTQPDGALSQDSESKAQPEDQPREAQKKPQEAQQEERPKAHDALRVVSSASNPFAGDSTPGSAGVSTQALNKTGRPSPDMFAEGSDIATLNHEGWDAFVDRLENQSVSWAASLEHAELQRVEKGKVIIAFESGSANASRVEKYGRELLRFLKRDFANVTGLGIDQASSVANCPYRRRLSRVKDELGRRREAIGDHPVVSQLVERFDANVARVRVYGEEDYSEH